MCLASVFGAKSSYLVLSAPEYTSMSEIGRYWLLVPVAPDIRGNDLSPGIPVNSLYPDPPVFRGPGFGPRTYNYIRHPGILPRSHHYIQYPSLFPRSHHYIRFPGLLPRSNHYIWCRSILPHSDHNIQYHGSDDIDTRDVNT